MDSKDYTITTIFLVPTLGVDRDKLIENNFVNGYYKDLHKEGHYPEDSVFLLFKPKDNYVFKEFLDYEYERTHFLIDDYEVKNGHVVLVYMLDRKWDDDFTLIKEGKYSKVSSKFKELFPETRLVQLSDKSYDKMTTLQWRIFYKSKDLKEYWEEKYFNLASGGKANVFLSDEDEVWQGWDEKKETLIYE